MMWERRGKVNRLIDSWSELFWNPHIPNPDHLPPTKDCPQCRALLVSQARICPKCHFAFPVNEKEAAKALDLSEVKIEKSPEKMIRDWIAISKKSSIPNAETLPIRCFCESMDVKTFPQNHCQDIFSSLLYLFV